MVGFVNELSLPVCTDSREVITLFNSLGQCYKDARKLGIRDLKVHAAFFNHAFAPYYYYSSWLSDKDVDEDLQTLLKSVLNTTPTLDVLVTKFENDNKCVLKFEHGGNICHGLGLASDYVFKSVSFSYESEKWIANEYEVVVTELGEDEDGVEETEVTNALTKNIAVANNLVVNESFISDQVKNSIQSGNHLWNARADLFPNLVFCDRVRQQLSVLHAANLGLRQIIERLYDLQMVASELNGNPIKPEVFPTKTSKESATRERDFQHQLTITCPDGHNRFFTWHSRFTPGPGRIHFAAEEKENRIYIGYIGEKIQ